MQTKKLINSYLLVINMEISNYFMCKELGRSYLKDAKNSVKNLISKPIRTLTLAAMLGLYACGGGGGGGSDNNGGGGQTYECNNNQDDDGDTLVDMLDPGCSSSTDDDEYNAPLNQPPIITSTPSLEVLAHNGYIYDSVNRIWKYDFNNYQYDADAVDPENDLITYYLTQAPNGMAIDSVTGLIEFPLSFNELGKHNVTVAADDGNSQTEQNFVLDVKYPYVDENGNLIADYDFVKGNDELVQICETPCVFFPSYPVNLGGNIIVSDEDYFNKKFIGFNYGFDELNNLIGVTPDYRGKPNEVHIRPGGDTICTNPDIIANYFTRRRNQGYAPSQGVICITNSGQSGLDPTSLLDQITFIEEMAHANQSRRTPSLISPNFYESQARAITAVLEPESWSPPITSYCDPRLGIDYEYARVINKLCTQCGFDKDKEPLFWNRVAVDPAGSIYELAQAYTEITSCMQEDVENIFINNYLYQCSDGVDNDSDGLIDLDDPNCTDSTDTSEFLPDKQY